MSWTLLLVIVILVAILIGLKFFVDSLPASDSNYRKLGPLLTPAERSFYGVLQNVVGDKMQTFAKVRVADVISPERGMPKSNWQSAFNRISAKHFDFVLCDPGDLSVICTIELDDKSHDSAAGKKRDSFLESACESANLPLVRFKAQAAYKRADIEGALSAFLHVEIAQESLPPAPEETPQEELLPSSEGKCPKCGSDLVKRLAKKGKNAGQEFMACGSFPNCRYAKAL